MKKRRSGTRRGPARDKTYREWIQTLPCFICIATSLPIRSTQLRTHFILAKIDQYLTESSGITLSECAHLGERGLSQKSADYETGPLCTSHHTQAKDAHHNLGKRFWDHHRIDKQELLAGIRRRYEK